MLVAAAFASFIPAPRDALAHLSREDVAELLELYCQDEDKRGFLAHVRRDMLAAGIGEEKAGERIASLVSRATKYRRACRPSR